MKICKNRFKNSKKFVYYNENMNNFKHDYLGNDDETEGGVKTKNALFFMNFPNINKNWQLFPARTGPLKQKGYKHDVIGRTKIGC